MVTRENVGKKLFNARMDLVLTQLEIGKKCGLDRVTVNRLENGKTEKVSAMTLAKISKFFKSQGMD